MLAYTKFERFRVFNLCVMLAYASFILVGWSTSTQRGSGFDEENGVKSQILNLIRSIRTVLRSEYTLCQ